MSKPRALDAFIEAQGGEIRYGHDGKSVEFPERAARSAVKEDELARAIQRAAEFGTTVVRLWRERGEGWYAASSHEEHPGFSYICQIDEQTGQPVSCGCDASVVCHHLGACIADWRSRGKWAENDQRTQAIWHDMTAESAVRARRGVAEEAWQ